MLSFLHHYKVPLLGFSATLTRHDQYDTKDVFPICVKECDITDLTKRGR
jgi:superfamily II DNA or RNA helicase